MNQSTPPDHYIQFSECPPDIRNSLVVGVVDSGLLHPPNNLLSQADIELCNRAIEIRKREGCRPNDPGNCVELLAPPDNKVDRILLCGLGDTKTLSSLRVQRSIGCCVGRLMSLGVTSVTFAIPNPSAGTLSNDEFLASIAFGIAQRNYRYDKWLTDHTKVKPSVISQVFIACDDAEAAARAFSKFEAISCGIHFARQLSDDPPNVLYPASFADRCASLTDSGVGVSVLGPIGLRKLGMNGLLAVGGASSHKPRLLILSWNGRPHESSVDLAFVGKGITFDTGGLDLKKPENMIQMKGDMSAGGAVAASILSLARLKAKCNVVGLVPLAENSVSGSAYRPSDIIVTACGASVEICNPDAEGRLVLMDALWYASSRFHPETIVSMGTLSGSGIQGLGRQYAGLYCEADAVADVLLSVGASVGENLWRLPTSEDYDSAISGSVSDYLQQADEKSGADGTFVTRLLQAAVKAPYWAHIEMAYLDRTREDEPLCPRGSTGWGVKLLVELAVRHASAANAE